MSPAISTGYVKRPAETNSCSAERSLNWVIRRSSPKLVTEPSSQAASGWALTWLWTKTVERSGSRPVANSIAARSRVESRSSAGATPDQTEHVLARLQEAGVHARVTHGREATVIGAIGERELLATLPLEGYPGVEQVLPILKPYKLVAREVSPDPTVIDVDGHRIGQEFFGLIAGPCSVEYREQTLETARAVASAGATMLRGGGVKPRGPPYTFQGAGGGGVAVPGGG